MWGGWEYLRALHFFAANGGGRAAGVWHDRERRACLPGGFDDREHAQRGWSMRDRGAGKAGALMAGQGAYDWHNRYGRGGIKGFCATAAPRVESTG